MFARHTLAIVALVGLTACGGGGGGGDGALKPTGIHVRSNDISLASSLYTYDPVAQSLTSVTENVFLQSLDIAGLPGGFDSFTLGEDIYFIAGRTPSEGGEVVSGVFANGATLYDIARLSPTNLPGPDAGTVDYAGSYAGQYRRLQSNGTISFGHVFGNANMDVDFADSSASGFITERERSDGLPATQVRLVDAQIIDGVFFGETRGGAFVGGTAAAGDYQGFIVGSQGQEIVGAVQFVHGFEGSVYSESGSMILNSD